MSVIFYSSLYALSSPAFSSHCCCGQLCSTTALHRSSLAFGSEVLLPPPHGILQKLFGTGLTGECEEAHTHWDKLLPLRSQASESTVFSSVCDKLRHCSYGSQGHLSRIKLPVPTVLAASVMHLGLSFLPSTYHPSQDPHSSPLESLPE